MTLCRLRILLAIGGFGLTMTVVGCTEEVLPQAEEVEIYTARSRTRAKTSHLLLSYEGAWRANTRRTKEDALLQAEAYLEQIRSGVDFAYLAQQYSEDPQKKEGGLIGVVERGRMVPEFDEVVFDLKINEISDVVETGFGFHIIRRLPLEERRLIHIQVDTEFNREIVETGLKSGLDPRMLAREYSTGPHGIRGGELGWFERKDLNPIFEEPAFALQVGTCTDAIVRDDTWHYFCRQE